MSGCCFDRLNLANSGRESSSTRCCTTDYTGRWAASVRVGNAALESFFALLQRNVLDRRRWSTRAELRLAIVIWIERTYDRRRRQRALGRLTPIEFELLHTPVATAA